MSKKKILVVAIVFLLLGVSLVRLSGDSVWSPKQDETIQISFIARGKKTESWSTIEPVSYTHLDVYKRQPRRGGLRFGYASGYQVYVKKPAAGMARFWISESAIYLLVSSRETQMYNKRK